MGATLAISEQGRIAIAKASERQVELYGGGEANQIISQQLVTPCEVCFAPNNHLVIADTGDSSIKVYSLDAAPQMVARIICFQQNGKNKIEAVKGTEPFSPSLSLRCLTPYSITAGPSPLSQLFAVFGCLIFVITLDWGTTELLDYRELSSSDQWPSVQLKMTKECNKTSIVHDHKDNHKVGGLNPLAVTKAQFCAMFYHVTERARHKIKYKCLHRGNCRVGKKPLTGPKTDYALTVVVYVRLTDTNDRLIFHARYGNCFEGDRRNTIHAEYFMLMDGELRQAVKLLRDQKGGKIIVFMNKQPCFRSTRHRKGKMSACLKRKECAQDLVNFYNLYCSSHGIKFIINLCQLHKVDAPPSPSPPEDIRNAQQGMKMLINAGIELKPMSEESWTRLATYADIALPEYQGSERQKLDQHIDKFIHRMGVE